jgi:hypothetical protein
VLGHEQLGQPLGRPDGGQRLGIPAARELEHPAAEVQPHPGRRLNLGPDGALGVLEGPLRLLEPPLGDQGHAQRQMGQARDRLLGPAVPPGQFDRLHAPLRPQRERPPAHQLRQVRQAIDLQIGPTELARQGDAVLEVPFGLLQAGGPQLGDAEIDQRQRPQVSAQTGPGRAGGPAGSQQRLRLLGHGREVAALAGQPHAHDSEHHLRALTPARRC